MYFLNSSTLIFIHLLFLDGHSHANTKVIEDEDEDHDHGNGDGIQLSKGYANSSGIQVPTTLVHAERDSLW